MQVSMQQLKAVLATSKSLSSASFASPGNCASLWHQHPNSPRNHRNFDAPIRLTCSRSMDAPPALVDRRSSRREEQSLVEQATPSAIPFSITPDRRPAAPAPPRRFNVLQQLAASALDVVEKEWIPRMEAAKALPSTVDPRVQLQGNFSPVPEHPVMHKLQVEGKIPASLEGIYLRNGANPQFPPLAGHHFFDGDGMVHAVRFSHGLASYCCRYTRTYRFQEEARAGKPLFPKPIGELHAHSGVARLMLYGARVLAGLLDASRGMGVANAGLLFHHGKLLAMSEDDLPYHVRITPTGDLETEGRYNFRGQLKSVQSMIAHPKVDPTTGEMFNLSYNVVAPPFLKYFHVSADGIKSPEVDITLQQPTMMHDFAITENFVVVPDQQLVFRMKELLQGGSPVLYDATKPARFGLLPRYDTDETRMQWIEVPDCFCFHLLNAWEENENDDEVVVIGSCMTPVDSIFNDSDEPLASILSEIRLNRTTGRSTRREIIPGLNLEVGQVANQVVSRKSRYAYLAVAEPWPKVSGIAKVELTAGGAQSVVGRIRFPDNCYGGEPYFVSRTTQADAPEDDGYILTFMHNEQSGQSQLLVLDAQSPSLHPLAKVQLPARVPYGFHGTYVRAKDIEQQRL